MKAKPLALVVLAVVTLGLTASPSLAQSDDPHRIVYVCYWTGDEWLVASQFWTNAERAVANSDVMNTDAFGSCPTAPAWALGMDSTPMAGYCSWRTGIPDPGKAGQGWYLGIGAAASVAQSIADDTDGFDVWLEADGTCPDTPAPIAWDGAWNDELGVVHHPEE